MVRLSLSLLNDRTPSARRLFSTSPYWLPQSNAMLDNPAHKTPTAYKLVCLLPNEKVLGVHIVGEGSDEIMQFVGVAVKMGGAFSLSTPRFHSDWS